MKICTTYWFLNSNVWGRIGEEIVWKMYQAKLPGLLKIDRKLNVMNMSFYLTVRLIKISRSL